jgi:hypothetical protein
MLPARRLLSMQTQNICPLIRIANTPSGGVVVPPDRFCETDNGSSFNPTEAYCLRVYPSDNTIIYLEYAKDIHLFFFKLRIFFTSKKYA